jgi:hypothetical protein
MFCTKCGGEIPEGSAFCVNCGAKVDEVLSAEQAFSQQPYNQQAYSQQPYDQQPYGQQPPYGQPPKKGKAKAWPFIVGGAVLLLAIAAVLIFVVFGVGGGWPFSGNTVQTKFANDAVKVFTGAFEGMGNPDLAKAASQPFDIDMDVNVNANSLPVEASLSAAYDNEVLGIQVEAAGQDIVAQLDEDVLYLGMYGQVQGYEIDTDADLSKPMTLKERFEAIAAGMSDNPDVDYIMVAEAMLNSISEDCFEKSGNEATLTMTPDDIVNMLKTLQEKADKDDKLADALDAMSLDLDDAIDSAESMADNADYELVCTITYEGGKPVGLELNYDDGTDYGSANLQFGYEKTSNGRDISLALEASGTTVTMDMSLVLNGKNVEYEGEADANGETMSFDGSETWQGNEVEGSVNLQADGQTISIDYSGTVAFGMPKDKVEEDSRFEMDKENATVGDIEDLYSMLFFGGMGFDTGLMG